MVKKIQINFTNKWLYSFIAVGVLILLGVGVYAFGGSTPNIVGHSANEIAPPAGCEAGQVLQWSDTGWKCGNMVGGGTNWALECINVYANEDETCDNACVRVGIGQGIDWKCTSAYERSSGNPILCHKSLAGKLINCRCCKVFQGESQAIESVPYEIIFNQGKDGSTKSCDDACGEIGLQCLTVGTDVKAYNGNSYEYDGNNAISILSASCSTKMTYSSTYDSIIGDVVSYTRTNCQCMGQTGNI